MFIVYICQKRGDKISTDKQWIRKRTNVHKRLSACFLYGKHTEDTLKIAIGFGM